MKKIFSLIFLLILCGCFLAAAEGRKLPEGLIAHYSFDSTIDGGWTPCSVDTNNNAKVLATRWSQGWNKSAYALNGNNSRIDIKDGRHFNISRFSISMHIKGYKIKEENRIIFDKGSFAGYILSILGSEDEHGRNKGRLCFEIQGKRCLSDQPVTDNAWYNIILTVDEKFARMYIDGKLQKESAIVKKAFTPVPDNLVIGAREDKSFEKKNRKKRTCFEGVVDELMIFNRALTQQEVDDAFYCSIPHYNKKQVQGRMSDIDDLLERKLITKEFHARKLKELSLEE